MNRIILVSYKRTFKCIVLLNIEDGIKFIQDIDFSKYITFIASYKRLLYYEKENYEISVDNYASEIKRYFQVFDRKEIFKNQTIKTLKYHTENNTFIVREKLKLCVKGDNLAQVKLYCTSCWEGLSSLFPFQITGSISHQKKKKSWWTIINQ